LIGTHAISTLISIQISFFFNKKFYFIHTFFSIKKLTFSLPSILAINRVLPATKIRFCYFHLKAAIRKKGSLIFGKFYFKILNVEFTKFWFATTSLLDLEHNIDVFEYNLEQMFDSSKVEEFMNYFKKQYLNRKGINPEDWLHIGLKMFFYYDATNITSESLNNVLKKKRDSSF